jgi:hypothetical protein
MKFANSQYSRFHDNLGKEILTNPGLNLGNLNAALAQPDLYLPNSPDRNYLAYFSEDPEGRYNTRDATFCQAARHPRDLPRRLAGSTMGCGWYFISEPSRPSFGILGTMDGPVIRSAVTGGGEWIWDINTAIMKEDIKNCKRVKLCDLMNIEGIHGVCGFCERLGYAVPINANGTDKYPESQDGACGEPTVMTVSKCFKPPPQELVSEDGTQCGTYGTPSPDNSIRLYTAAECSKLGGNRLPSGECMMQGGGSFSSVCRGLNDATTVSAQATKCAPDAGGNLTRECLISLATGIGYSKSGAVLRLLQSTSSPNETDRMALDTLKTSGMLVPDAILGAGNIDADSAGNLYQKIYSGMTSGQSTMAREAAKWLVVGTNGFDICEFEAGASGPFPLTCMQRAFRQAGCQAAGGANPTAATASKYANMTWAQINTTFKDLRNTVKSSDADVQDKATAECLGIKYYRTPAVDSEYDTKLNTDSPGNDINCYTNNEPVSRCRTECTNNSNCRGYLEVRPNTGWWGGNGGCCTKYDVVSRLGPYSQLTLRPKIEGDRSYTVAAAVTPAVAAAAAPAVVAPPPPPPILAPPAAPPAPIPAAVNVPGVPNDKPGEGAPPAPPINPAQTWLVNANKMRWWADSFWWSWYHSERRSRRGVRAGWDHSFPRSITTIGIGDSDYIWSAHKDGAITTKEHPGMRGWWGWHRGSSNDWNYGGWRRVPGGLVQVDGKSASLAVGVNSAGDIYKGNSAGSWTKIGQGGRWASIGADGTIWYISNSTDTQYPGGGGSIFRYLGSPNRWEKVSGSLIQISVGDAGNVWGVNANNDTFKYIGGNSWSTIPGKLKQVSVSAKGERVVGINLSNQPVGWSGAAWVALPAVSGGLVSISVGKNFIIGVSGVARDAFNINTSHTYFIKLT